MERALSLEDFNFLRFMGSGILKFSLVSSRRLLREINLSQFLSKTYEKFKFKS